MGRVPPPPPGSPKRVWDAYHRSQLFTAAAYPVCVVLAAVALIVLLCVLLGRPA